VRDHDPIEVPTDGEHGVALIVAVMVLTAMIGVTLFLCSITATNRRMGSDDVTKSKALHYAEAGVCEALNRIENGEGPDPYGANAASQVVQVLLATSVGAAGADTTLLATGQPSGDWITYSTATSGLSALTIEFKTNAARTMVLRYDKTLTPPVQTYSGDPIYRITSTGTLGAVRRTIVTEVCYPLPALDVRAGFIAGDDADFGGNCIVCGHNHRADTPTDQGSGGRAGVGGCAENPSGDPPAWEWPTGSVPGIWSTGTAGTSGSGQAFGTPATSGNNVGFYAGPWEILGMTKAEFFTWVGPRISSMPANPNGVYYLDNDGTKQNASGNWDLNSGAGVLYVDGDLDIKANWRGLIYAEGKIKITGTPWVLGGIVCKGSSHIDGNGTVLYSKDAIEEYIGIPMTGRRRVTVSWKEI